MGKCVPFMFFLLARATAHNWQVSPPSRNDNKAATTRPCPVASEGYVPYLVAPGEVISSTWTTNHAGDHFLRLAPTEEELEAADKDSTFDNKVATGSVTAPATPGNYVLQYGWANYRNCVDIKVDANYVGNTCTSAGEPAECKFKNGRHSDCVANKCVCLDSYTMNSGGVCIPNTPPPVSCQSFCTDAMNYCVGAGQIYTSKDDCLFKCATYPIGTTGDTTGNSLHCRFYHLHIEGGAVMEHCPHAAYDGLDPAHCAPGEPYVTGYAIALTTAGNVTSDELTGHVAGALQAMGVNNVSVTIDAAEAQGEFVAVAQMPQNLGQTLLSERGLLQGELSTASSGLISGSKLVGVPDVTSSPTPAPTSPTGGNTGPTGTGADNPAGDMSTGVPGPCVTALSLVCASVLSVLLAFN